MAGEAKELRRRIAADEKAAARAELRQLRRAIIERRELTRRQVKDAREACKSERGRLRERAKQARARLSRAIEQARKEAAERCAARKALRKRSGKKALDKRKRALRAARAEQASAKRWAGPVKTAKGRKAAGRRAAERRSESDDAVRANLEPWQVPIWERVKRKIKAGPRRSRTEAFLEWLEENPEEARAAEYEAADADVERMIAEYEAQRWGT